MIDGLNLYGKVKNGKLEISNKDTISQWIKTCDENTEIIVKIRKQKDLFSNRQLRLIYHEFREVSNYTGYSVEDVKTMLKMKFGYCYCHQIEGKEITICKSISEFNRAELSLFIEQIDLWASKTLGTKLLTSDDIHFLNEIKWKEDISRQGTKGDAS